MNTLLLSRAPKLLLIPGIIYLFGARLIAFLTLLFLFYFFSDPITNTTTTASENIFFSPSYGTVQEINRDNTHVRVSIYLSLFDPHIQYTPIDSILVDQVYKPGDFKPIFNFEKTHSNERMINYFNAQNKHLSFQVIQIAGMIARTIDSFEKPSTELLQGEPFGMIQFGSRVDIILPINQIGEILVKKGQYVKGGITPICKI
jgi:phosphatidylserine decarboxylase